MGNMNGMFGIITVVLGVYCLYNWLQMKQTGEISKLLMSKDMEAKRCKNQEAYVREASMPLLVMGLTALVEGGIDLLNTYVLAMPAVFIGAMIVFAIVLIWFAIRVSQLRKKYF